MIRLTHARLVIFGVNSCVGEIQVLHCIPFPDQEHKIIMAYKSKHRIKKKDTQLKKKYIHTVIIIAVCYAIMDGNSLMIPVM